LSHTEARVSSAHTPSWTEQLLALQGRPITEEDRRRAALHLLDWLGCVLLGHTSPAGEALSRWAANTAAGPCWTVGGLHLSSEAAALVNGGLGNVDELDDLHRAAVVHPADTLMAAALAVAQREQATPQALLDAIVRGYEVAIRVGLLAGTAHYRHWYSTATCGVFGAATASASVLQLDATQAMYALAQAGMQASGVWQCRLEPGFSKQLAAGRAAQSGLMAADLAAVGVTGPRFILEGEHGWLTATHSKPNATHAAAVLRPAATAAWLIHEVSFKPWSACRHVHPAITCALQLHGQVGDVNQITHMELSTYQTALDFADQAQPHTRQQARFSLQHAVAVGLLRGDFGLADTQPQSLAQPALMRLRGLIRVRAAPRWNRAYPAHYGAQLRVRLRSGETLEARVSDALGDPEAPMSQASVVAKAQRVMQAAGYSASVVMSLTKVCADLPQAASLTPLWQALRHLRAVS
jgi:2-methylcitrate dehydratase PrpD